MQRFGKTVNPAVLNQLVDEFTQTDNGVRKVQDLQQQLKDRVNTLEAAVGSTYINNITFSWNGATTTISWTQGYVKDRNGKIYPVLAGSRSGLSASTAYWTAWNPKHQSMIFTTSLSTILANRLNFPLVNFTTGTGAQTGNAGGGGTTDTGAGFIGQGKSTYS